MDSPEATTNAATNRISLNARIIPYPLIPSSSSRQRAARARVPAWFVHAWEYRVNRGMDRDWDVRNQFLSEMRGAEGSGWAPHRGPACCQPLDPQKCDGAWGSPKVTHGLVTASARPQRDRPRTHFAADARRRVSVPRSQHSIVHSSCQGSESTPLAPASLEVRAGFLTPNQRLFMVSAEIVLTDQDSAS